MLVHNGSQVWGAQPGEGIKALVGRGLAVHLQELTSYICPNTGALLDNSDLLVELVMPRKGPSMAADLGRASSEKLVLAVNRRVVQLRQVERVVKESFCRAAGGDKFPVGSINIHLAGDLLSGIDHNLEPNKQKVIPTKDHTRE